MTINSLAIAVLFAGTGIVLFGCAFVLFAKFLPGQLWKQAVEEKNVAAAVLLAGVALALGWIIAGAVH